MSTGPAASLLAFDTSTERLAVAACGPRGACAVNVAGGAAASAQLVPQINAVLERLGLAMTDLAAIAYGRGPGAFTGLRTSCAVAQGLGLGLDRPVLPLDSLLVVAEDALDGPGGLLDAVGTDGPGAVGSPSRRHRVAVAMDARMDEIYAGVYERDLPAPPDLSGAPGGWRIVRAPALHAVASWNAVLEQEGAALSQLAGSAITVFGARLHRPAGVPLRPTETDRACALLRLALAAHQAGAAVDAAQALPLYLRDKVALTTAERAAGAAAGAAA